MSAPHSELQYYVRRGAGLYQAADMPMSANQARYTANNLRHLHDVSFQHRVNVMGAAQAEGEYDFSLTTSYAHITTLAFPWTFDLTGLPAVPVIRVGGQVDSGTMTVVAYMNPANTKADYDSDVANYMFTFSGSWASSNVGWIIEDNGHSQVKDHYRSYGISARHPMGYTEHDGTTPNAEVYMLRLSIYARVSTGTPNGQIDAISLRETPYR